MQGLQFDSGLTLIEDVPEAHKVALVDIEAGSPILRYGSVIGYAEGNIAKGSWVHEERMRMPVAPSLVDLPLATAVPAPMAPVEGYTFEGFLNDDGSVGTKNILGITTTVQCVAATVDYAVKRIKAEMLPRYPNVDDVIALTHNYGCGVAIDAPGAEIPIRTLRNLSLNPNLGGAPMVVSLGCEKLQPVRLLPSNTLPILAYGRLHRADAGRAATQFRRDCGRDYGDGGEAPGAAECAKTRDAACIGPGGRAAVWWKRCVFRRDCESCGGLCVRLAGARGRDRDVLGGH